MASTVANFPTVSLTIQASPRQQAILRVIEDTMADRGYPPSVREIGHGVGLTSPVRWPTNSRRSRNWASASRPPPTSRTRRGASSGTPAGSSTRT